MKRREFMKLTGASAAAGLIFSSRAFPFPHQSNQRPNVLFIMVDDLRPELGCYGVHQIKSPNVDRIAKQGIVFTRAYCPQAICNPSRASLLTGKRPDTLRVWDNSTHFRKRNPGIITLPQIFKSQGYHTLSIGKIFHGTLPDPPSWNHRRLPPVTAKYYMSPETQARQKKRADAALKLGRTQGWIDAYLRGPATEAFDAPDSSYRDGALTEIALQMLSEYNSKQPFFLAVGFSKPHLPFVAPQRYWNLYRREEIPLAPNNFMPKGAPRFAINSHTEFACYEDLVRAPNPTEGQLTEDQARLLKHGYYACVSFIDAQIGRIFDCLDTLGLRENTIVVVTGEHGYKLGEHGSWGKMTNYEIDLRFPLIISVPGKTDTGVSTSALVEIVDIYPTVCELAGLKTRPDLEGISLVPLFQDSERPWKQAAFSQFARGFAYRFMGKSMRTERYRFTEWRDRIDNSLAATELYDHETDPQENINIAGDSRHKELVSQLSSRLAAGWKAALPA
jgi:iduronate 2-sulfatase